MDFRRTFARAALAAGLLVPPIGCHATPQSITLDNAGPPAEARINTATQTPHNTSVSHDSRASPTAPANHDEAPALRVMSFNLRTSTIFDLHNTWGLRKALLVKSIRAYQPDLLGTQECQLQQARYLRKQLPGYGFVGAGRSDGEAAGERVGLFYRKSRFIAQDTGHFWLSDTPKRPGSETWDGLLPRMVTWARLKKRTTGDTLYMFNTHFSAFGDDARRKSARLLKTRIRQIAGNTPTIITGDFNAPEHSRPHNIMLSTSHTHAPRLRDTFRHVFPDRSQNLGTLHGFDGNASGERIDWILASTHFNPTDAAIKRYHDDGRYPSDHFPVTATLHWPPSTADASNHKNAGLMSDL